MSFDPELPELHDLDPRLCAGPHWLPEPHPEAFQHPHDWGYANCWKCGLSKDDLRRRFAEWRYEALLERNTAALEAIGVRLDELGDSRAIPREG